ncbi:TonB-dependent siderophore receptor [Aliarcobacter lanthieri]|uniref:TonB-dependent siderophore receptor n=1 Tax=Aliarcobacter lanthieri TaxID=1355374 RepID=UPI003AAD415F
MNSLNKVLESEELKAVEEEGIIYIIDKPKPQNGFSKTTVIDTISVNESYKNGSAESGYLVENVKTLGVWGNLSLQDTPYSMNVMSAELMENMGVTDIKGVTRANPVLQDRGYQDIYGGMDANIRGFRSYNTLIDGSPVASFSIAPNEEADRIEVISGFSGFLYGGGNVGGAVNYVLKRPTSTQMNKITVGNNGGENYYTSFDSGGPINDKWGYRISGIYQDGETSQENRKEEKKVITAAVDFKATDDLLLQIFASHRDTLTTGQRPIWLITGNMPTAYDTSKSYTPEWGWMDNESDKVELSAKYNFSENWSLRTAYIYQTSEYENQQFINIVNTNTNTYTGYVEFVAPLSYKDSGGYAYLDGNFSTGFINHNLTMGASVDQRNQDVFSPSRITYNYPNSYSSVDDFKTLDKVAYNKPNIKYRSNESLKKNIVLGDNISFNEQLNALIGVNLAYLKSDSFLMLMVQEHQDMMIML